MTSKDKESKSLHDKLKQMFKGNKGNMGTIFIIIFYSVITLMIRFVFDISFKKFPHR